MIHVPFVTNIILLVDNGAIVTKECLYLTLEKIKYVFNILVENAYLQKIL